MPRVDQDKSIYWSARWRALRKEVFERDGYICQACGGICYGQGRYDPNAPECDHIIPHRGDEALKWDINNLQTLHKRCHSIKTISEDGGLNVGAKAHPDWLPRPACPVTLVCGAPGSGKTTWAHEQSGPSDDVIDLDDCFRIVCGVHGHHADRKHLSAAIRVRNKMLANLASKRGGRAYVIVAAPTQEEREWWVDKLGAEVHLMEATMQDIEARDLSDQRIALARDWFQTAAIGVWRKSRALRQVGLDGYPV